MNTTTATRRASITLAFALTSTIAGCCFAGGTAEPPAPAALSPAQETQLMEYCRQHCESTNPGAEDWLRDACASGCATGHREEMAAGTWTPPVPDPSAGPAGCPNSTECMQTCQSQCEAQHGPMSNVEALRACIQRNGTPEECATAGINAAAATCFRNCRGLP